jgi:tRNA A37 threonylcarbamoyladenosine dehydratase
MSSWLPESHKLQLAVTALASGCIAASAVIGLQNAKRWYSIHDLKGSIPDLSSKHDVEKVRYVLYIPSNHYLIPYQINDFGGAAVDESTLDEEDKRGIALARRARLGDYDEALILEQLARNRVFLTDEGLAKLRNAFVIIVGCGGVGSHAAAALARSGCGKIRLIDFDQVTLSSLNRHAVATLADVGTPKVACLQRRLEQIVPWTQFDSRNQLYDESTSASQLEQWKENGQQPSFVIDAIDNIESKVALLAYCHANNLPVISSMGAGCKSDPTRVFIGDISNSTDDPLSRSTRRRLRLKGVKSGIPVVYSSEKTAPGKAQLLPLPEEQFAKGAVNELGVLPDFRVRILPVLGTMPAVFGLCVANHVMLSLTSYPGHGEYIASKGREKMYEGILAQLQGLEERVAKAIYKPADGSAVFDTQGLRIPVNSDDVGYLVDEVFRGRSVISGLAARLALTRWRKPEGEWVDTRTPGQKSTRLDLGELVCMTKDEMLQHEKLVLKGGLSPEEAYGADVVALVEQRREEEKGYREQRG